jgi:ATP-dependent Lon protease
MIEIAGGGEGRSVPVGGPRGLPATMPVLPLRETVPLPDTLTPLAIGQERSIELVNDVLAGNRMLVMVASKNPELEQPGPDELFRVGVVGSVAHDEGARRHAAHPGPGRPARADRELHADRAVPRGGDRRAA